MNRIRRLLIANRGEIACRVIHSAKSLGIACIAVYSDADRRAAHVAMADEAIPIGPAPARRSYLNQSAILNAARASSADALHPGYGFLSENASFAQAVLDAGVRFVGPSPEAIAAMGSKANAKALMAQAGVPLVPGYAGDRQDPDWLAEQAEALGYPVLIKASAGGGGKGMRRVDHSVDFAAALTACQREALASFGDASVLIERYLLEPRHIEVQIFGDQHGRIVSLLERDCSLQRRHQKVMEEAPAPGWTAQQRKALSEAAIAAARAVNYVGAGTVEFIVDSKAAFYFMEMNTRLQVEHPVTEMIVGEDLVAWQLKVAMGEALPAHWDHLQPNGHAIEARLYAENPRRGFLPSSGLVQALSLPESAGFFSQASPIRIDAGIRAGDVISADYDPMIAKLIVHGKDREQALDRLGQALAATSVLGPSNNRAFLQQLIAHPLVQAGQLSTALIENHIHELAGPPTAQEKRKALLAIAAAWALSRPPSDHWDAFEHHDGWRHRSLQATDPAVDRLRLRAIDDAQGAEHVIERRWTPDRLLVIDGEAWKLGDGVFAKTALVAEFASSQGEASLRIQARLLGIEALHVLHRASGDASPRTTPLQIQVDFAQSGSSWQLLDSAAEALGEQPGQGSLIAPMPGKVIAIHAAVGDEVRAGQVLLVIEAMKMEHSLQAEVDGKLLSLNVELGDQVADAALLAQIERTTRA